MICKIVVVGFVKNINISGFSKILEIALALTFEILANGFDKI
jgi:hypothetical protein